ncbi:MAG: ABC transporter transmembrane domain-containing protein [Pseudomonadota bacterium]
MSNTSQATSGKRDHSIFDADIHGKAMSMKYLGRILGWAGTYKKLGLLSIGLVLLASLLAVMLPVMVSRVVIDGIIIGDAQLQLSDFGLKTLTNWIAASLGTVPIVAACLIYGVLVLLCHGAYHLHRVTLAKTVLSALRDMRRDLFAHLERRPASFYDKVSVGRVMTRITNDVQVLFELLMGIGMLIGEFVPFFLALALMLAIDAELTLWLLVAIPVFAFITWIFRLATRRVYRQIRNTVSLLNKDRDAYFTELEFRAGGQPGKGDRIVLGHTFQHPVVVDGRGAETTIPEGADLHAFGRGGQTEAVHEFTQPLEMVGMRMRHAGKVDGVIEVGIAVSPHLDQIVHISGRHLPVRRPFGPEIDDGKMSDGRVTVIGKFQNNTITMVHVHKVDAQFRVPDHVNALPVCPSRLDKSNWPCAATAG